MVCLMNIGHFLLVTDMISLTCAAVAVVLQSMAGRFDGRGVMLTRPGYSHSWSTATDDVVVVVVDLVVVGHQLKMSLMF